MTARCLLLGLLAVGCLNDPQDPQRIENTTNAEIRVALLFEHDGCKVYRFRDRERHYFVKCTNAVSAAVEQTRTVYDPATKTTREVVDTIPTVTVGGQR